MNIILDLATSVSATKPLVKGDRVVFKEAKDKWFLGTVTGVRLAVPTVLLDRGDKVRADVPRNVKLVVTKKSRKSALTDVQAKELVTGTTPVKKTADKKPVVVPATVNSPVSLEMQQVDRRPRETRAKEKLAMQQDRTFFLRVSDWARDNKFELRKPVPSTVGENITAYNPLYLVYFIKNKPDSCLVRIYPNSKTDNTTIKFFPFIKLKDSRCFDVITEALKDIQNNVKPAKSAKAPTYKPEAEVTPKDLQNALLDVKRHLNNRSTPDRFSRWDTAPEKIGNYYTLSVQDWGRWELPEDTDGDLRLVTEDRALVLKALQVVSELHGGRVQLSYQTGEKSYLILEAKPSTKKTSGKLVPSELPAKTRLKLVTEFKDLINSSGAKAVLLPHGEDEFKAVVESKTSNIFNLGTIVEKVLTEMRLTTRYDSSYNQYTTYTPEGQEAFKYSTRRY